MSKKLPWEQPQRPEREIRYIDFREASAKINPHSDVFHQIARDCNYVGTSHNMDALQDYHSGDADVLEGFALFKVDIDGETKFVPLSPEQLNHVLFIAQDSRDRSPAKLGRLKMAISDVSLANMDTVVPVAGFDIAAE